jgi:thiamine biosynthesis lipoprotein
MGSEGRVLVLGGRADLATRAEQWVAELERRWTRFRPDSELMRLNGSPGRPVVVSMDTFAAIAHAVDAWRLTYGRFDPTVFDAVNAAGYDRDFAGVRDVVHSTDGRPSPGCDAIVLDPLVRAVTLPEGVRLDLGGIGKGFGADLVVTRLLEDGAHGACVALGGDLRVGGIGPEEDGAWRVLVEDPYGRHVPRSLRLRAGGVATTTRLKRRWFAHDGERHHVLDPRTGRSAYTGLAAITAVAGEGWFAEALAKAGFVAGITEAAPLFARHGATGLLVDDGGSVTELAGFEAFRA